MNGRSASKIHLENFDSLFGNSPADTGGGTVEIEASKLKEFKNHPYKVLDDDDMNSLVMSVKENGILNPVIVRKTDGGDYEIISGHRRKHAAVIAGLEKIPCIVKELDDDGATILMVDSNMYRSCMSFSEKAFAYRMKNDAMKNRKSAGKTAETIGKEYEDSARTVYRFIRLTYLIPQLLKLVDEKKLQFMAGVNISYLAAVCQGNILRHYEETGYLPDKNDSEKLKNMGSFTLEELEEYFNGKNTAKPAALKISRKKIEKFFDEGTPEEEIQELILRLLEEHFRR